ncbi:MAG: SH3 domain-containing protein [Oscillatoriales cyanobacterium RM1_1_9]|nr:SH3 domain-containing protein [Oscillatoriales cyanobacterium SM2_3_0]NJO46720.1 SH3 domain-containing protein [Oscillatoriales cyanobacterium RM2_1_1]NJO72052.1 SH3 domain-containing protein [Oscillatoriales cyanobacterium RM1_1_9]
MGRKILTTKQSALVASALSLILAIAPAIAQSVPAEIAKAAEEACIRSAGDKGFVYKETISVEPKTGDINGAVVVLSLDQNGQIAKLTCGYSASTGAMFDDGARAAVPQALINPWLLFLPALIGFPLFLWWWGNSLDRSRGYARRDRTDAIVRNHGRNINIYSGPEDNYDVTGYVQDGQRVTLSGLHKNEWVELAEGGWIRSEHLESSVGGSRYATTR